MSVSAFGVEHSEDISKKKKDVRKDPNYRKSYLEPINPRSETYVRRGTGPQRVGGPAAGGVIGGVTGGVLGGVATASPVGVSLGTTAGAVLGASAFHNRNVKSGDTVGINRRTGKKAKSKTGFMDTSFYGY